MAFPCIPPLLMCIHQHRPPCTHFFQHKNTVPGADELRQFCNASLVQVRPRETAVVEIDFRAAVFPIPRSCTHIPSVSTWDRWHHGPIRRPETSQLTCLWLAGHLLLDRVRWRCFRWSSAVERPKFGVKTYRFINAPPSSHTHCFSGCTTAIFLSFSTEKTKTFACHHCLKPDMLRSLRIRSLYCHCTRNATLMEPLGLCTWGFDGVDEWIPVGLTPADWEDVEGVHVNYQLRHWLFQACRKTFWNAHLTRLTAWY